MGCDIHLYSETRRDGRWVADKASTFFHGKEDPGDSYETTHLESSYSGRNYRLFGTLAEVRSSWPWSFKERGMPADASPEVAALFKSWDMDAHTPSWLTRRELQEKATELLIRSEEGARDNGHYLMELIEGLPVCEGSPEDQRIVFWFDN